MSIERELLIEAKDILADYWDPSVTSIIGKNRKLYYKLKEYLEKPELTAPPKRELLTGSEISQGFIVDKDATNSESYWAGVALAEKHYGITGVDDEH